jgi:hypothetical protein
VGDLTPFGVATVTVSGTYAGVTINFEFSDDGGTTWFQNTCTRTDTNIQEVSETLPTNQTRAWDCGLSGPVKLRVRASALSSGTVNVGVTATVSSIEPAPTMQLSASGVSGSNPCLNPHSNFQSIAFTTSGTTAVQEVALSAGTKIYVCSLSVVGQSGTTPTFSLVTGTGANCGSGQATLIPAFATPANTMIPFASPVAVGPSGAALCYLDSGTTPVQVANIGFVQQ